jgi:magnesium-transporting ATPase (P-type)
VQESNRNLEGFSGTSHIAGLPVIPLNDSNLLLRATQLQNTNCVVGCVVYAGMHTKIMLNLRRVRHKISKMERRVDYIQAILLVVLFFICLAASLLYFGDFKQYNSRENIFYLRNEHHWSISKDGIYGITQPLLLV